MKIKELMIEDWVMYHNGIDQIQEIYGLVNNVYLKEYGTIDVNKLSPISLTTEILEKNEFYYEKNIGHVLEHYNYEIIYATWEHELRILKDREQILKIKTFDKMCVHELQHALRLCGINKEIEI